MINHVEAILPALDIQRRLDERGLDEVLQQSAIALCGRTSQGRNVTSASVRLDFLRNARASR